MAIDPTNHRAYVFGDFRVDSVDRVLIRDGELVPLTPKVLDLLLLLLENHGQVVEKDRLMREIWPDAFVEEGNLTQNISVLRKALGEDGDARRYIQTIPRRGYRFVGTVHNPDQPEELMIEEHARSRIVVEQIDRADSEIAAPVSETQKLITDAVPQWWSKRIALAAIGIVLVVVTSVLVWNAARKPGLPLSPEPITAIAVLPMTNSSNSPDAEYLADGITESIISNLSQIGQLKVMARATVFRFKGAGADPQKVGRDLGVGAVLTGRLLQQGNHLIIRTELVNVADGTQLWGAEYDRNVSDVLAVQQDISREISENLRLRLTGDEKRRLLGRDTMNAEAYQSYLRGRYSWNKRTADDLKKAIAEFHRALDQDSNYALAYAGLADCYLVLEEYTGAPGSETLPQAKAYAERALQINDSLAEAHTSLAFAYDQLWQWDKADEEFKRSIELNPNYSTTHHWYNLYLRNVGRFEEAMAEIKRAEELDPLSPVIAINIADLYVIRSDRNSVLEQSRKITELDPTSRFGPESLALADLKERRYAEAISGLEKAVGLSNRSSRPLAELGYAYAISGRRNDALQVLKELEHKYSKHEAIGQNLAIIYSGLGDKDQAFAWLEKDFREHSGLLPEITWWFFFQELREDPRYAKLVRGMGLKA